MRLVLGLVALAIVLTLIGGVGFIAFRIAELDRARIAFGYVLWGSVYTTFASLLVALVVGLYHLYLYWFTDRRPLSLFTTTRKDDE